MPAHRAIPYCRISGLGCGVRQPNALQFAGQGRRQTLGADITKTNNTQNRIENRDFVSLDPEQNRIKTELAIEKIEYHVIRSESLTRSETAFDLTESTTAAACASDRVHLVVQLKREIGKLWENIEKAPYELSIAVYRDLYGGVYKRKKNRCKTEDS